MRRDPSWLSSACACVLVLAGTSTPAAAQEDEEKPLPLAERPVLRVNPLTSGFQFDGRPGDPAWKTATDSIAALTMVEPDEGSEATESTVVKVFASADEIMIAVRCYDSEPNRIVSFSKARDSDLTEEDHIVIALDTFLDARSGYVFAVNPTGVRYDGLVPRQGDEVNVNWDTIWEAKTSRDAQGWYAEIKLPLKSLSFERSLNQWGFNVERNIARSLEIDRWSGVSLDYAIYQMSRAGLLAGLPRFDYGIGLTIRPAVTTRVTKPGPGRAIDYDVEPSLDIQQKITSNLVSALTVRTDFAETEVDVLQINVTRFPSFFPEKRTFFLEGADVFEFGAGLDEESLIPFFSRRIGLIGPDEEEQLTVPINVGGKINGRVGNTNLGALVVNTRESDDLDFGLGPPVQTPPTTMGSFRVSQNVLEESSVGVIATFGDQADRSGAWMAGADFTFETSSFRGERNLLLGVWGLRNDRDDLTGDKGAWGFRIDYPNDLWDVNLTSIRLGNGFDPSLAFMQRNNVHIWDFNAEFKPRAQRAWLRQMFHEFSFTLFNETDNSTWQGYTMTIKPVDWLLETGDRFDAAVEPEGDRPPAAFEVAPDIDVDRGSYEWVRYSLGARSAERRRLSSELRWTFGNYYNGDLDEISARLTYKPSALLALEGTGEWAFGSVWALPDDYEELMDRTPTFKRFTERLFGFRVQVNFSPELQFSSLTQYDTTAKEFGSNNRLRWTFDPLGDFFVVYNVNLVGEDLGFQSSELPIKLEYAFRF